MRTKTFKTWQRGVSKDVAVLVEDALQQLGRTDRTNDYRIIDENGREVWASDLAKRYKNQSRPRQPLGPWWYR